MELMMTISSAKAALDSKDGIIRDLSMLLKETELECGEAKLRAKRATDQTEALKKELLALNGLDFSHQ